MKGCESVDIGNPQSLAGHFERYIRTCYPPGVLPDQREQLKDAFVAAAYLVLDAMTNEMGEEETVALCQGWIEEAMSHADLRKVQAELRSRRR
jgi:hypothetical protein